MTIKRLLIKYVWKGTPRPIPTQTDGEPVHRLHHFRWTRVHEDVEVMLLRANMGCPVHKNKIKVRHRGKVFGNKPALSSGHWCNVGGFIELKLVDDYYIAARSRVPIPTAC